MVSPALIVSLPTVKNPAATLTLISSAPQIATRPIPRATTAACEVLPPLEVKIP